MLWAWDVDPEYEEECEEWLFLKSDQWNAHVQYAWRYDPCKLAPQGAARPPPRASRVDTVDPWVTETCMTRATILSSEVGKILVGDVAQAFGVHMFILIYVRYM